MTTLDDLFEEEAQRRTAESDAYLARPEVIARAAESRARGLAQIEREIAEGIRDADGNLIEDEDEDEDDPFDDEDGDYDAEDEDDD